jgi:Tfp pilus assembly PilM family ATPase
MIENQTRAGNDHNLDAVILSGGTADLSGLADFFQNKFNVKVLVGNPFSRVQYDAKLEPAVKNIKTRFSVCLGLALMGIESKLHSK